MYTAGLWLKSVSRIKLKPTTIKAPILPTTAVMSYAVDLNRVGKYSAGITNTVVLIPIFKKNYSKKNNLVNAFSHIAMRV